MIFYSTIGWFIADHPWSSEVHHLSPTTVAVIKYHTLLFQQRHCGKFNYRVRVGEKPHQTLSSEIMWNDQMASELCMSNYRSLS